MQTVDAREQMIEQQVRAWDVLDERVLDVMRRVPRELFVPASQRYRAYADDQVPLGHAQHMLRPSVAGRVLQALLPAGHETALEIGAGSGFLTGCLAAMAGQVQALEIFPDLAASARANLDRLGARGASVCEADALQAADGRRYDVIAVTASLPVYDPRFERRLQVGGRLFVVVGVAPVMEARLVRRLTEERFVTASLFETVLDPLINATRPEPFTF